MAYYIPLSDCFHFRTTCNNLLVISRFKHFRENYSDAEPCLKDMHRYAKFFRRVIFNYETKFADLPALDKKFYELTFLLKADNAPIILMYLLYRYFELLPPIEAGDS